jgi:hypothetical protein
MSSVTISAMSYLLPPDREYLAQQARELKKAKDEQADLRRKSAELDRKVQRDAEREAEQQRAHVAALVGANAEVLGIPVVKSTGYVVRAAQRGLLPGRPGLVPRGVHRFEEAVPGLNERRLQHVEFTRDSENVMTLPGFEPEFVP